MIDVNTAAPRFDSLGFSRERFAAAAAEQDLAGVLLTSGENIFYATGYPALPSAGNPILYALRSRYPAAAYIDREGTITLLCWGYSAYGVEFGADEVVGFTHEAEAYECLERVLRDKAAGRLGVEPSCPRQVLQTIERAGRSADVADGGALLTGLRLIKSDAEIAAIQRSTDVVERTVAELNELLEPGMSRLALMDEARRRAIANGATGISHITFSFGQQNPEHAIDEPLDEGFLATLDLGAIVDGYCSDNRRYAFAGEIPAELQDRYERMVAVVDGIGAALVPGATYAEVFARAAELHTEHGFEMHERATHVGHHIGLETEEEWITNDPGKRIEANMVINIEQYSFETGPPIGDEETFVVGPDGTRRITSLPREIHRV
jgi:Xaa-Pro aminopeptidase